MRIFLLVLLICVPLSAPSSSAPAKPRKPVKRTTEALFARIRPELERKTKVPLRLPSYLPVYSEQAAPESADEDLLVYSWTASESGYSIGLGFDPNCEGEHACSWGGLSGGTKPNNDYPDLPRRPVLFRNGVKGYYVEGPCGSYCADSVIGWREGRFYYEIASHFATRQDLIRSANSAIPMRHVKSSK